MTTQSDIINANFNYLNDNTLNKQQITNCILNDPQNIKLELSDGTLTLKAGSVVCVPNGFEEDGTTLKFDEVEIESDVTYSNTLTLNKLCCCFYRASTGVFNVKITSSVVSGTEPTDTSVTYLWYDTSTNLIKFGNKTSGWVAYNDSLPFALVSSSTSSAIDKIDQTFQSIGYIGSTVFVRKGLKVLIPNGRNDDGSLNNIEWTNEKVRIATGTATGRFLLSYQQSSDTFGELKSTNWTYNVNKNFYIYTDGGNYAQCVFGSCTLTSGVISDFQPYSAIKLATEDEIPSDRFDGQWITTNINMISSTTTLKATTTYTYDISASLPNDGYVYEVIITCSGATGTTSGNSVEIGVGSNIVDVSTNRVASATTRTSSSVFWCGNTIIPIGTDRQIYIRQIINATCTCTYFRIKAIRRIGTNS